MAYSKSRNRTCINCGKSEPRQPREKAKFFCSKSCKLTHRRKIWAEQHPLDTSPIKCKQCGNDFIPNPLIRYKAKYCSERCKKKGYYSNVVQFYKRHPKKKAEYHFKQRKRKKWRGNWWKALTRDKFTCQLCGFVGAENSLSQRTILVHHLDGEGETGSNNHSLDNLSTTCYDCHEGLHGISLVKISGQWYFKGKILQRFNTDTISIWKD
ncbi:hypothetical protein LCGC14_2963940 [marine sediment metagenome]|uniref:HNH nuclease domain-containing protein n=1 Tax=marine sediment metagenome TaxID=412755 RepID=A0A0F8XBF0_9ZZZZ